MEAIDRFDGRDHRLSASFRFTVGPFNLLLGMYRTISLPRRFFGVLATLLFCLPSLWAGQDDLRIIRVNPASDTVWITHFGGSDYTVAADMAFCHSFNYQTRIRAGTTFGPEETKTFTVAGLNDFGSDLWLYRGTSGYTVGANIVCGLHYGGADSGRTRVARDAGLWTGTDNPDAPTNGQVLEFDVSDPTALPANGADWRTTIQTVGSFPTALGAVQIASGLQSCLGLEQPPGESERLFLYEQHGRVIIRRDGVLLMTTPFLDVSPLLTNVGGSERGLLGLAFHPQFQANGRLYTYTSEPRSGGTADFTSLPPSTPDHHSVIREWRVDAANADLVDESTTKVLLRIEQPQSNHNGGDIAFGPDGFLYIALGDGGGGGDSGSGHPPEGNGQSIDTLLGCIARIDVDGSNAANGQYGVPADNPFVGSPGLDEIYAYGLRNPYRMSFDFETGDLYTGDVGQNAVEEVDLIVRGGNYGWPIKEGTLPFNTDIPDPGNLIDPIAQYGQVDGRSVMGGFVYRGALLPELTGKYVFGDFINRLFVLQPSGIEEILLGQPPNPPTIGITGLGTDNAGEIYFCGRAGQGFAFRLGPLLAVTGIEASDSEVRLQFAADDSLSPFSVEGTTDLEAGSWSPVNATIGPKADDMEAVLPPSGADFQAFRVRGE